LGRIAPAVATAGDLQNGTITSATMNGHAPRDRECGHAACYQRPSSDSPG
jgi:hypothetical protein